MRRWCVLPLFTLVACGSSGGSGTNGGPIENIVKETSDGVRVKATRYKVALADLPVGAYIGLPVTGMIEVDSSLQVPVVDGVQDVRKATGSIAVRCVDTCRIGDDVTRLKLNTPPPPSGEFVADGIPFGHLDLSGLEAEVTIADGTARLTRWRLESADIAVDLSFSVALAQTLKGSTIDACMRFHPTAALKDRDRKLYDLLTIMTPANDADGRHHVQMMGTVDRPRLVSRLCGESP